MKPFYLYLYSFIIITSFVLYRDWVDHFKISRPEWVGWALYILWWASLIIVCRLICQLMAKP